MKLKNEIDNITSNYNDGFNDTKSRLSSVSPGIKKKTNKLEDFMKLKVVN